jgi:hypothetical protein
LNHARESDLNVRSQELQPASSLRVITVFAVKNNLIEKSRFTAKSAKKKIVAIPFALPLPERMWASGARMKQGAPAARFLIHAAAAFVYPEGVEFLSAS